MLPSLDAFEVLGPSRYSFSEVTVAAVTATVAYDVATSSSSCESVNFLNVIYFRYIRWKSESEISHDFI